MRARTLLLVTALALSAAASSAQADDPLTAAQDRSVEPVVLTGAQLRAWSAGPDPTLREPGTPTNYDTFDQQQYLPEPLRSECYYSSPSPNPYDDSDNGDHNCYQSSRLPRNPLQGAPVDRILGYRWTEAGFEQIPFQVDERFTRYISNNGSGFAFYSGVDAHLTYAWDREPFRFTADESMYVPGGDECLSMPAKNPDGTMGPSTMSDPVVGLDDDDELVFMWSDAGAAAPVGAPLPEGIESAVQVVVADPSDPSNTAYAYVMLAAADGPRAAFDASTGYVRYQRDADADMFVYSQSSYDNYGAAPKGPYCELDGTVSTTYRRLRDKPASPQDPLGRAIEQRRPLDTAWVKTPRYWFRYDGRWLMTGLRISPDDSGLAADPTLGPDIIDQWKARAFQQRPGGETPCCGYEEEVNNWGGSSILMGERVGPVRAIRAAWGADSSTNNIRIETFYRDEIRFGDALRVHVIPPLDGIYVQWDYNAGKVATYYNPFVPEGVPADGQNDEVFGNTRWHVAQDRIEFHDDDPIPVLGPQHHTVPLDPNGDPDECEIAGESGVCNDIDLADPFFSGPAGNLNWEQVSGPFGGVVTRWTIKEHNAGDAYSLIAQPYYRDDSCFDDGTGTDPGPHLHSRNVDDGVYGTYTDADGVVRERECWLPEHGDPALDPSGPRRFWQGDIATHGLHLQLIADSDNAMLTAPVDEIVSEQRMVVLPPSATAGNVGERYGRHVEYPLTAVVVPFA